MIYGEPLIPATFRSRPNRFLGEVEVGGEEVHCFIPDPGRLKELLQHGRRVHLLRREGANRKTFYDLVQVVLGEVLVSTDSRIPNRVFEEAVEAEILPEFQGFRVRKREPVFEESRLDFMLGDGMPFLVEVKSCTLVKDGVGLFPDAPTSRGAKHVKTLTKALRFGRAALFFLVQREDAELLKPYTEIDPKFSRALEEAVGLGVEVHAYNSTVTSEGVFLNESIPVLL